MAEQLDEAKSDEVVGWGALAEWARPEAWTMSRWIGRELASLGVQHAFGVLGGGIAPFADGFTRSSIKLFHTRHEAGAVFAAIEAHFATDRPTVAIVTTGPGLFNALNGAMAARADGAKVLVVSGATTRNRLGRGAVQETGPSNMPGALTESGHIFHLAARPETDEELVQMLQQLAIAWTRPGGCVAHLAIPWSLQVEKADLATLPTVRRWDAGDILPTQATLDACLDQMGNQPAAIWIGHGARGAAKELLHFAEAAHLPVISSPRAKGVFDENHRLYVGTSGAGGHRTVGQMFAEHRPHSVLVLGTRLGEVTSFLSEGSTPSDEWIHVDIDPRACGAAYPATNGMSIECDAKLFLSALHDRADERSWFAARPRDRMPPTIGRLPQVELRATGDVRHEALMQVVQDRIVDRTDAIVMSEAGNSFTWCNYALRFRTPNRYRVSAAWGSMGHYTSGPIGAALTTNQIAVTIVGDGAMLMHNELSTAVTYRARTVWIVLNDAQFGLNEHGMRALGMRGIETQIPRTDFVAYARSLGADGEAVKTEVELAAALDRALAASGPYVVDVRMDRTVPSPILAQRIQSLASSNR